MVNRVKEFMQKLVGSKTRAEIQEYAIPKEDAVDLATTLHAKTDTSEDYYTSFERKGRGHKGRTFQKERQQLLSNPRGYVHRSKIIKERAFFIELPECRNIVAYYSPWGSAVRKKIPEELCMSRPIFALPNKEETKDGIPEENMEIVDWWEDNRMNEIWYKSVQKSFIHGPCIYYPLNLSDAVKQWYTGLPAYVISTDEARPYLWHLGHPVAWEVIPTNKELEPYKPNASNSVFFDYSNSDDFDGVPYLIAAWDSIIDLEFIKDAVNAFDQRMGNGFMVLVVPNSTKKGEMDIFEKKLKHLRTNRGLVVKGDVEEPVQIDWMGMGGAQIDFVGHIDKIEDSIAMDLGFPKRWLLGDPEGAMESSGKDALQINIKLKALFKPWTIWMKLVLRYHKLIDKFSDIDIRPSYEMQLSEQEKVEMDQIKTTTIATKTWLTVDEQRELDGYEPMTEEQKSEIIPPEPEEGDNNDTGDSTDKPSVSTSNQRKSDAYDLLNELFNSEIPISELMDITGVAKGTVQKMRAAAQQYNTPILKQDDLQYKTDAVNINNNIWRIEDVPLVLPQEKQYGSRVCVRPKEEVAAIFNDPKTPKQFRIGVTPEDDHTSRVPLEVLNDRTVGTVNLNRLDEEGNIRGDITYDLGAADNILGDDNWLKEYTELGINPNTSVALYTKDRPNEDKYIESNLDIRSFVFTKNNARNKKAGK